MELPGTVSEELTVSPAEPAPDHQSSSSHETFPAADDEAARLARRASLMRPAVVASIGWLPSRTRLRAREPLVDSPGRWVGQTAAAPPAAWPREPVGAFRVAALRADGRGPPCATPEQSTLPPTDPTAAWVAPAGPRRPGDAGHPPGHADPYRTPSLPSSVPLLLPPGGRAARVGLLAGVDEGLGDVSEFDVEVL
jgi:hypothetical protein